MTSSLFTHQRHEFNNQFASYFGDGFQDWFVNLARLLYPAGELQGVRLTQGDGKLDAVVLNKLIVFQCYAPQTYSPSEGAAKIRADFAGAYEFLEGRLKEWVFVHNHPTGSLDKLGIKALNDIATEVAVRNESTKVFAWGKEHLWEALSAGVAHNGLQQLFGSPDPVLVDFASLEALLLALERADYPEDAIPVSLPSEKKLDFNELAPCYRRQILEGRGGLRVMDAYLASWAGRDPEFAERLAQRFRDRYQRLRQIPGLSPDDIYERLRLDAGWRASPDVKREMATRIVLAYFFDTCDIFENPTNDAP